MQSGDTIVAISSAIGAAPRMIVRMSGPDAIQIATRLVDHLPEAGASPVRLRFRDLLVPGTVYRFDAPNSVTAEHVIEFHLPGNVWIVRQFIAELIAQGARQAEPGEFTARSFFNGKIDLTEAEGVAAIVSARSEAELNAARRLMSGELARRLQQPVDVLADTLALIEAGIDFSDEPVSFLSASDAMMRLDSIAGSLRQLLEDSPRFERISHEPQVVLAGRPNAGKSTLLNALAGNDRAVVSHVAGTTRDAIGAVVHLRRGLVRVIDIAGLESSTNDSIDEQMQSMSKRAIEQADVVLRLVDPNDPEPATLDAHLTVFTKADLGASQTQNGFSVSAKTGMGMSELRAKLDQLCFGQDTANPTVALTGRHVRAVVEALGAIQRARIAMQSGAEIVALELREALDQLGTIRGAISSDDVLGRVFASFCIGK
ncbi:MAG: tRNA modification GTPase [Anaerolineae bacterium]|nr:tRNA modification GTPase [Phycisphaerae bacterium]